MQITQIREKTVAIASPIANAYIDFSKMTAAIKCPLTSLLASVWAATSLILTYSSLTEDFRTASRSTRVISQCQSCPGSVLRENPIFMPGCRPSATKLFQSLLFRLPPGCFPPEIVRDHRRIADAPTPEGANIPLGL